MTRINWELAPGWASVRAGAALLTEGDHGPAVEELQKRLSQAGFALRVDGYFGEHTAAAVRAFQSDRGLLVDGSVGIATLRALGQAAPSGNVTPVAATFAADALAPSQPVASPEHPSTLPQLSAPGAASVVRSSARLEQLRAAWPASMRNGLSFIEPAANGGRPVAVWLPPGFDASRPAKVVTYFHGHNWNVGSSLVRHGLLERVQQLAANDAQTVFIFPQAARPPFSYWMRRPESFLGLEQAALAEVGRRAGASITVEARIVDAHSGGGWALANAVRRGELAADKVNLLDATYSNWGQTIVNWALDQNRAGHPVRVESWYTRHQEMVGHNHAMDRLANQAGMAHVVTTHDVTGMADGRDAQLPSGARHRRINHNSVPANFAGTR